MQLPQLPTELIQCIVAFLDVDDIEDIGLTCRRLRSCSVHRLQEHRKHRKPFATIRLGPKYEDTSNSTSKLSESSNQWDGHPINILNAVRETPRLARYVKCIQFTAGDQMYYSREGGVRRKTRLHLERSSWLSPLLANMGIRTPVERPRLAASTYESTTPVASIDSGTMAAYLTTLTPNLRELKLTPGADNAFSKQAWKLYEHKAHQTSAQPLLALIERVSLEDSTRRSDVLTTFLPFIRWTAVRTLHCRGGRNDPKQMPSHAPYAAPAVQSLELEEALVNDDSFDRLLDHLPGLRSLRFIAGSTSSSRNRRNDKLRPRSLIRSLEEHCASTLRTLTLDVVSLDQSVVLDLSSFNGLHNLRGLYLNASHYFADNANEAPWLKETPSETIQRLLQQVPESLRHLHVRFGSSGQQGWCSGDEELKAAIEKDLDKMRKAADATRDSRLPHLRRGTVLCSTLEWSFA